jgi:hypothetical protein
MRSEGFNCIVPIVICILLPIKPLPNGLSPPDVHLQTRLDYKERRVRFEGTPRICEFKAIVAQ